MVNSHIPENDPNVVVKKLDNYKVLFLTCPKDSTKESSDILLNRILGYFK
jgi:hypothetical protein